MACQWFPLDYECGNGQLAFDFRFDEDGHCTDIIHPDEPGYLSDVSLDCERGRGDGKGKGKGKEKKAAGMKMKMKVAGGGEAEMGDTEQSQLAHYVHGLKIAEPEPMDES